MYLQLKTRTSTSREIGVQDGFHKKKNLFKVQVERSAPQDRYKAYVVFFFFFKCPTNNKPPYLDPRFHAIHHPPKKKKKSIQEKVSPIVLQERWQAVTSPRRTVSGSCAVGRRNFSCRVSLVARRAAATSHPRCRPRLRRRRHRWQSRPTVDAVGWAMRTIQWYMTGNRGTCGGHRCRRRSRAARPPVSSMARAIRVGPTAPRRTSPAPRPSSSPAALVPGTRRTTYYKDPRRFRFSSRRRSIRREYTKRKINTNSGNDYFSVQSPVDCVYRMFLPNKILQWREMTQSATYIYTR